MRSKAQAHRGSKQQAGRGPSECRRARRAAPTLKASSMSGFGSVDHVDAMMTERFVLGSARNVVIAAGLRR